MLGIVRHRTEAEGKNLGRPMSYHIREEIQSVVTGVSCRREFEVLVQEQELVSKADHRSFLTAEPVAHSAEDVVEVDHNVRTDLPQSSGDESD